MNQIQLNVIRDVLREKSTQVRLNKTWQLLHGEHGIGKRVINGLCLNERDYQILENLYQQYRKDNVLDELPSGQNRLETVKVHRNEKNTSKQVFADQLVFASVHHDLPLKSVCMPIGYPMFVPTIDIGELDITGIKRLVVLENATMLLTLHEWYQCLPTIWQSSLFVYRGQGQNQSTVKNLLAQLGLNVPVAIYADFDPSGLSIVMNYFTIRPVSIIVPKGWEYLKNNHSCNQTDKYLDQFNKLSGLSEKLAKNSYLHRMFTVMQAEKIAMMQEHVMFLNGVEYIDL
ncbi:DUF7281 domain-containing protein [Acinetobacter haemolyticus]|uniref:DUF7281 domain-containing protein n=1 Tax=Acinetobacter haemolyticus TaxID=29430 RepID=UPI002DBA4169|nr:hypothetical protein [Acinetobacter haemolyticus]MEB6675950.1 hypothetical protein [Acinetobacter haemolyticus]